MNKEKLHYLISNNKINDAFDGLFKLPISDDHKNALTILKAWYNRVKILKFKGENIEKDLNLIYDCLLHLGLAIIDDLKKQNQTNFKDKYLFLFFLIGIFCLFYIANMNFNKYYIDVKVRGGINDQIELDAKNRDSINKQIRIINSNIKNSGIYMKYKQAR